MRPRPLALLLALALPAAAGAQDEDLPPGLAGLLPTTVHDGVRSACLGDEDEDLLPLHQAPDPAAATAGGLRLRPWPDADAPCGVVDVVHVRAQETRPVPTRESDYEQPALLVLEVRGGWRRIALHDGASAWLRSDAPVLDYPQLLAGRMAHAIDPEIGPCAAPGAGCPPVARVPGTDLEVLSVRVVDGEAWLHVQALTPRCGAGDAEVLAQGWIRARRADGRPAAWFHSRGC